MMKSTMHERMLVAIAVAAALVGSTAAAAEGKSEPAKAEPAKVASPAQASYTTPVEAVQALHQMVTKDDVNLVQAVLGPDMDKLVYTGDAVVDRQMRERFLAAYAGPHRFEWAGEGRLTVLLGDKEWPFPFPLLKEAQGWRFDAEAGAEEIINRRLGENELFAMKFCLAYGDAQREYAEQDRDGDGLIEYAQKFRSSEGKRDGLFWKTTEGEPPSPLGPLAARAKREGYRAEEAEPAPYHGYYYRILTRQGKDAPGGAYDYIVNGSMIGGYALVGYPARWGASGVMSFICGHGGGVYQNDLGEQGAEVAEKMTEFNPDASWRKTD